VDAGVWIWIGVDQESVSGVGGQGVGRRLDPLGVEDPHKGPGVSVETLGVGAGASEGTSRATILPYIWWSRTA